MTLEEIEGVVDVLCLADAGCTLCVSKLLAGLCIKFSFRVKDICEMAFRSDRLNQSLTLEELIAFTNTEARQLLDAGKRQQEILGKIPSRWAGE